MTPRSYRFVREEPAFEPFVQLSEAKRELAHSDFRWLETQSNTVGQGFRNATTGQPSYAGRCEPFLIVHGTDHAGCEVRRVQVRLD